jgi:predicted nucleic acid-binding protein
MALCRDLMNLHQIDLGEASALVYASQCQAQGDAALLVMDDFRGRTAAKVEGVAVLGTAGLLLLAKQAHLVDAAKPLLAALSQNGYFLSDRLIEATVAQAGES